MKGLSQCDIKCKDCLTIRLQGFGLNAIIPRKSHFFLQQRLQSLNWAKTHVILTAEQCDIVIWSGKT